LPSHLSTHNGKGNWKVGGAQLTDRGDHGHQVAKEERTVKPTVPIGHSVLSIKNIATEKEHGGLMGGLSLSAEQKKNESEPGENLIIRGKSEV